MTQREKQIWLSLLAGVLVLAGPRRTRPLAGFLYGLALSRMQGASRDRLEGKLHDLFSQRRSMVARHEALLRFVMDELAPRVEVIAGAEARPKGKVAMSEPILVLRRDA